MSTELKGFGASIVLLLSVILFAKYGCQRSIPNKPISHKCKCLNYSQFVYAQAKYELYVDSISYGNKKKRDKYADSIIKYSRILKQND